MAIAIRGTPTTATRSTAGALAVSVPTGTVSGDVLVFAIEVASASGSTTTPSGLTLIESKNDGVSGPTVATFYRVCDGTEGASYSFTLAGAGGAGIGRSYTGVSNASPINQHSAFNKGSATASATATTVTPSVNGCALVFISGTNTASLTFTNPAGFVDQTVAAGAGAGSLAGCDETQGTAAATGSVVGTWSSSGNNWTSIIALAPAASGPYLVSAGAVVTNTGAPSFGTTTTANNLLIAYIGGTNTNVAVVTGSGWAEISGAQAVASANARSQLFYKIAAGSDTAPTFTNATYAQLAEYASGGGAWVLDQSGHTTDQASNGNVTASGTDVRAGDLILTANHWNYTASGTDTTTNVYNNGAITNATGNNDSSSQANHYRFSYGITNASSIADKDTVTFSRAINNSAYSIATFVFNTTLTSTPTGTFSTVGAKAVSTSRGLSATVSSSGTNLKRTSRSLAAAISTSGAIVKLVTHVLVATLSSSGLLMKFTSRPLAAQIPFNGILSKQTFRGLIAIASSSGLLNRITSHSLSATFSSQGIQTKLTVRSLAASVSLSALLSKFTSRTLGGTIASQGTQTKQTDRPIGGSLASSGTISRTTLKSLIAQMQSSGLLNLFAARNLVATILPSGLLNRFTSRTLDAATIASQGTQTKQTSRAVSGSAALTGLLGKLTGKNLLAQISVSGLLSKLSAHNLTASISSSALLNKFTTRVLSATTIFQGNQTKQMSRAESGSFSSTSSFQKLIEKSLLAQIQASGFISRFSVRNFQATWSSNGLIDKLSQFIVQFEAMLGFSGATSKLTTKGLTGNFSLSGIFGRVIPFELSAVFSSVGSLRKMSTKRFTGFLSSSGQMQKTIGKALESIQSFGAQFNLRDLAPIKKAFASTISFVARLDFRHRGMGKGRAHDHDFIMTDQSLDHDIILYDQSHDHDYLQTDTAHVNDVVIT